MLHTKSQVIEIQGHRGCRGLMPENTLQAFEKAISIGVQTLELDIAISKDKKVIVSHEPYMSRTICLDPEGNEISKDKDKMYNLYEMTYEEIKVFDCGTKFHKRFPKQEKLKTCKPLLDAVFLLADALNNDIKYNVEIKAKPKYDNIYTPRPKEFVQLVLQIIEKYKVFRRCNLQSFDLRILEEIKIQAPQMKVAILIDRDESILEKLKQLSFKPEIISPFYKLLNKEIVEDYKQKGLKVIPWTVNSKSEMKKMISFSVDGIITDYPDLLFKTLQ
jgi:glycerophosphoryl diester phosphodiesterase